MTNLKGNSEKAHEYITNAENSLDPSDDSLKKCFANLREAKRYLKDNFIEFPKIRDALFKKLFDKDKIDDWTNFLEILYIIRNAQHNGFVLNKTKSINCSFLTKSYQAEEGVTISANEIQSIIKGTGQFLKDLNTSQQEYRKKIPTS